MKVTELPLPGLLLCEPRCFKDARGFFMETWQQQRYEDSGIKQPFVQDNLSQSSRGVLRGLHFQNPKQQGKLVQCVQGEVFDVAVDIRVGSPTFAQWHAEILSAENNKQLWIPPGFAHGLMILSETALFSYKCTDYYDSASEYTLAWDDPSVDITWPELAVPPQLSSKDKASRKLDDFSAEVLPKFEPCDGSTHKPEQ